MERFQQHIQAAEDLDGLERITRQVVYSRSWSPAAQEVVVKIVLVMAEHVLRYAGRGHLRLTETPAGLEVHSEDRGAGFLRMYSAARESGLTPTLKSGVYEVVPTAHGDLATLRTLADELIIECDPGRGMRVRALLRGEPRQAPHPPCPCVIVTGAAVPAGGH